MPHAPRIAPLAWQFCPRPSSALRECPQALWGSLADSPVWNPKLPETEDRSAEFNSGLGPLVVGGSQIQQDLK